MKTFVGTIIAVVILAVGSAKAQSFPALNCNVTTGAISTAALSASTSTAVAGLVAGQKYLVSSDSADVWLTNGQAAAVGTGLLLKAGQPLILVFGVLGGTVLDIRVLSTGTPRVNFAPCFAQP